MSTETTILNIALSGEYTRSLKNLAKDLQIPVFAIAQLGRQAEQAPTA